MTESKKKTTSDEVVVKSEALEKPAKKTKAKETKETKTKAAVNAVETEPLPSEEVIPGIK